MGDSNAAASAPLSSLSVSSLWRRIFSKCKRQFRSILIKILTVGPIPKHIAIIMDGNRRFADREGVERFKGHLSGYDRLIGTLENCWRLGVKCLTVYAFSIENFYRSPDEVNSLMKLMEEKLDQLVTENDLLKKYGVKVQILGDLSLLPTSVKAAADRAMTATRENNSLVFNVCVAYTSTAEIVHSIEEVRDTVLAKSSPEVRPCAAAAPISWDPDELRQDNNSSSTGNDDVRTNETLAEKESKDIEFSATDCASSLEILGKQNADEAIGTSSYSSSSASDGLEMDRDMSLSESRNGAAALNDFTANEKSSVALQNSGGDGVSELSSNARAGEEKGISHSREDWGGGGGTGSEAITEEALENHLYTAGCSPPDILLRTSGETRLSNFMLWQCASFSHLAFIKALWPEFSLRHLALIILEYQRAFPAMQRHRELQEHLLAGKDL